MHDMLFHQNMQKFGGDNTRRNLAFTAAFEKIKERTVFTGYDFVSAGFTEIMNNKSSIPALASLAPSLSRNLSKVVVIEVGESLVGKSKEYIGIAWNTKRFDIQFAGQVIKNNVNNKWLTHYIDMSGSAPPKSIDIPSGNTQQPADSRGPAFIAGYAKTSKTYVIYMYMHNMYATGDRIEGFRSTPTMAESVRSTLPSSVASYANAPIYIGGDFNLPPENPSTYKHRDKCPLQFCAAKKHKEFINTTNTNPYDYWLTNNTLISCANAEVIDETKKVLTTAKGHHSVRPSDHAAIILNL